MVIQVSFKQVDQSEALMEYINEKCKKLEKYFRGKLHMVWNVDVTKSEWTAHCHLLGSHMDYFGEALASDPYQSIDLAISKIEKQVRKRKEILTRHHE
jgi:putative sigma-54 modulation protein